MKWQLLIVFSVLSSLSIASTALGQSSVFSGFYGGFEGGAISYNTQINFDGVDDPAGRGGMGYGAFFGYSHTYKKILVGAELVFNLASDPDPYTFDPALAGFSELEVRRGTSIGLDVRGGLVVIEKILVYGSVGYSANKQSVYIDGVPLDQFEGGAAPEKYGALQVGAGLEVAILSVLGLRVSFRTLTGHDLNATDFGTIPIDASLTHLDVKPSHQQFFAGLIIRL